MIIKHSGLRWNPSCTSKYNQWKTDENGKLVRDEKEVANIFNDFFVNIVPNLRINTKHDVLNTTNISHNPTENAIYKYENHPSVLAIKNHMKDTNSSFSFQTVTKENTAKRT